SFLEPQLGGADRDDVAAVESARPVDPLAVDEGGVRRAEVVQPDAVTARLESRVVRRRELVAVDRDVVLVAATDSDVRRIELELRALLEHRALDDDKLRLGAARRRRRGRDSRLSEVGRPQDEALLRRLRIAGGGSDDPPDE